MTFIAIQICTAAVLFSLLGLIYRIIKKKTNIKFSMYFLIPVVFSAILFVVIREMNTSGFSDWKGLVFLPLIILALISLVINAIKSKNT
ncbi:hypothetical protein ABEY61_20090 [Bacillus toyonensis]|uniref:hypothetical protein n=1 Tax=Bacillus toyonensis TaxID=155322 RepID=UPI003D240937